ncbi:MAG: hypothetical protein ABIS35_12030 [Terracoccus sp.]
MHALPLRHRKVTIGALNLFCSNGPELRRDDVSILQAVADVATIGILQERTIRAGGQLGRGGLDPGSAISPLVMKMSAAKPHFRSHWD